MKLRWTVALLAATTMSAAMAQDTTSEKGKLSYAVGYQMGSSLAEQKLDIGAISVNEVADQYLSYVNAINELDMDVASDFLVVAATLLSLKAASLLPEEAESFGDELDDLSPDDAREILIARLIAYKQFKNVAASLRSRLENEGFTHARQAGLEQQFLGLLPDYLEEVTLRGSMVMRLCSASNSTFAPRCTRMRRSTRTSSISGRFSITQTSEHSRAAGMTATEVFFPPDTKVSPLRACSPRMTSL